METARVQFAIKKETRKIISPVGFALQKRRFQQVSDLEKLYWSARTSLESHRSLLYEMFLSRAQFLHLHLDADSGPGRSDLVARRSCPT